MTARYSIWDSPRCTSFMWNWKRIFFNISITWRSFCLLFYRLTASKGFRLYYVRKKFYAAALQRLILTLFRSIKIVDYNNSPTKNPKRLSIFFNFVHIFTSECLDIDIFSEHALIVILAWTHSVFNQNF